MGEAPALGRPDELVVIGAAVIGAEIAVNGEIAARGRAVAIDADQRIGDVMAHEGQARVAASRGQRCRDRRRTAGPVARIFEYAVRREAGGKVGAAATVSIQGLHGEPVEDCVTAGSRVCLGGSPYSALS